jgi:excisionase family DNA binding protein
MPSDSDDKITIKQAAEILAVHPLTIRKRIKSGELTAFKVFGKRAIYLSRLQVESLKEPQVIHPTEASQ